VESRLYDFALSSRSRPHVDVAGRDSNDQTRTYVPEVVHYAGLPKSLKYFEEGMVERM
jgi:hypothetical protein